jgi:hypothetical protein
VSAAAHWSSSRDARPRFRLTAPEPLEVDIHEACAQALDRLLLPPAVWACYPAGAVELSAQQMARYSRLGLKRGWPDLMIGAPDGVHGGGMYGIELKRRGGTLSKTRVGRTRSGAPRVYEGQADVFPRLIASGAFRDIAVAHSVDEMLAQLAAWQIPLRARIAA